MRVVNNPNEVDQSRWFTQDELRKFCHDHAKDNDIATQRGGDAVGLERISPWFAAIERNGDLLHKWWDAVMLAKTPVVTDTALTRAREPAKIHREGTLFYYKARAQLLAARRAALQRSERSDVSGSCTPAPQCRYCGYMT